MKLSNKEFGKLVDECINELKTNPNDVKDVVYRVVSNHPEIDKKQEMDVCFQLLYALANIDR